MSEGASDLGKCGRTTKRNRPCTLPPVSSAPSCFNHLTPEERERHAAERAAPSPFDLIPADPAEPACWSWPVAVVADLAEAACAGLSDQTRAMVLSDGGALLAMDEWHQGRCAICGRRAVLVLDHDHTTNLVRGHLCKSCNVREAHTGGVFELYRQRPPAAILGVREQYWSPLDGL